MRPSLHPSLVNGRFGDPALFVEMLHRRGAMLFDMGDLSALSTRDLRRITHVFVSHMHIDHFIGFDALLRASVGCDKRIVMVGPQGFRARVHHKLQGYEWDLVDRYSVDLVFEVTELGTDGARAARFRFKHRFDWEELPAPPQGGSIIEDPGFRVTAALLDHHGPCLGYAVAEPVHANVWKVRLAERGYPTGQWLQELKRAVIAGAADEQLIPTPDGPKPLRDLKDLVTLSRGQKIAYVTDVADTPRNRTAIVSLAEAADTFFIEASFAAADAEQARSRAHLTTTAAGEMAKAAGVRKVEPFHFSPRYEGEEARMLTEVRQAFE
jgi:ribonuclease Z